MRNKSLPLDARRSCLIKLLYNTHPNIDTSDIGWDGMMQSKVTGLRCKNHLDTCRWKDHPPNLNNLIKGHNCPQCAAEKNANDRRKPFERDARLRHPPTDKTLIVEPDSLGRFDYSNCVYNGHGRIGGTIRCIEHNHSFSCRSEEHLKSNHGCCPYCRYIATSGANHHGHVSLDELKDRIRRFHGGEGEWLKITDEDGEWEYLKGGMFRYNFTGYVRISDYIRIYCPNCDRAWTASAINHVHPGNGDGDITKARRCQTCSGSKGEKAWICSMNNPDIISAPQHRIHLENEKHRNATNRTRLQVDGYDPNTKTVYEFLGCWYHGCPHTETCLPYHKPFPDDRIHTEIKKTMMTLRNEWYTRKGVLEELGYNVVSIWECEWHNRNSTSTPSPEAHASASEARRSVRVE